MNNTKLLESLSTLSVASLADADKTIRVMSPAILPVKAGKKVIGTARTVSCFNDFLTVIHALDQSQPGDVLVVDSQESTRALVGELFTTEAQRRGLSGIIVDGPVRDVEMIRKLDIPVFAKSYCPCSGTTQRLMHTQTEIRCGGVSVLPEEIVYGDDDGVIVASVSQLVELIPLATEIQKTEELVVDRMREGDCLIDMLNFKEHIKLIDRGLESSLTFKL
jgi:4-hydroxy-4-methyl-2-oxoglutarate aldolase